MCPEEQSPPTWSSGLRSNFILGFQALTTGKSPGAVQGARAASVCLCEAVNLLYLEPSALTSHKPQTRRKYSLKVGQWDGSQEGLFWGSVWFIKGQSLVPQNCQSQGHRPALGMLPTLPLCTLRLTSCLLPISCQAHGLSSIHLLGVERRRGEKTH